MIDEAIEQALDVLAKNSNGGDDAIVAELVAWGSSFALAEKLVALVPLAFGRVLLAHLGAAELPRSFLLASGERCRWGLECAGIW